MYFFNDENYVSFVLSLSWHITLDTHTFTKHKSIINLYLPKETLPYFSFGYVHP